MGYEELRAKAAREHEKGQVGAGGALGELPVSLAEHGISTARNNAPCLLPNNLLHALPSGSNGATALALSRDGTRGRASGRAPHHTRAQPHSSPPAPPSPQAPSSRARSTPRTARWSRSTTSAAASSGSASTRTTARSTSCLGRRTARSCSPSRPTARRSCGGRRRWRAPRASRWPPSSTRRLSSAARCSRRRRAAGATRTPRAILRARFFAPAHPHRRPSLVTPVACACPLPARRPRPAQSSDPLPSLQVRRRGPDRDGLQRLRAAAVGHRHRQARRPVEEARCPRQRVHVELRRHPGPSSPRHTQPT